VGDSNLVTLRRAIRAKTAEALSPEIRDRWGGPFSKVTPPGHECDLPATLDEQQVTDDVFAQMHGIRLKKQVEEE
jgi:hypothetical protein